MKFTSVILKDKINETNDAYTLCFEVPEEWLDYLPGQYITIKADVNGELLRRAYSISSTPNIDKHISVTIKAIEDGRVSNFLKDHLEIGDEIEIYPPMGNFTANPSKGQKNHYILIGAGSGITPLYSILCTVLNEEDESKVTLIYGNRKEEDIIFFDKLNNLETEHLGRLEVIHVLSQPSFNWNGYKGRIGDTLAFEILQEVLAYNSLPISCFICGPQGMMDAAEKALQLANVPDKVIHREYYSAPLPDLDEEEFSYDVITRDVKVQLDGEEHIITVTPESDIMHSCIDAGLDPPYACEEGICSTCRAKLHSGLVQMMVRDGLSDEEIEANYILTCQCNPLTDDVVVEFG